MSIRSDLVSLLAPFTDPADPTGHRFVDVRADTATRVLDVVDQATADSRPNGDQPPMRWLVAVAGELDARLVGSLSHGYLRFDGIQVQGRPAWSVLLARLARDWPSASTHAVAEVWSGWDAQRPHWTGRASAAGSATRSEKDVLGLWWD
jgi:hypothetical protein